MTQERFSWENCSSLPIDGSATLTMEASSTTTNCASASSASAIHFRSGASVGLKVEGLPWKVDLLSRPVSSLRGGSHIGSSERPHGPPPLLPAHSTLGLIGTGIPFLVSAYGIDVPLVKPYIHWHVTTRRRRRAAAPCGRAPQPGEGPGGGPRGLLRAGAGRADGRRGAARRGRGGHGLPPLPDQGGPDRGADGRGVRDDRRGGRGGARGRGPVGGVH